MALISLDKVSKIYPKGTRPALDNINLDIERGDFVFLVGASGSGKTTLLSLLLREEEATSGEIRVAGNDLRRISNRQVPQYRRSLGFVFQDYKLLNNKTVWENVAFALEVIGTRRSTIRSLVTKVLDTVGLTGKEKNYPHELSGGEQQRVAIARAYVNHPQILLADEPTGNLDPTTSLGIMEVLDSINRTGTTVVMATHNEEIVNSMRKRVVELHNGKIVRDEAHGSYDSALFFPDAEVEARSDKANRIHVASHVVAASDAESVAVSAIDTVAMSKTIETGAGQSEGIARLASSVHSGRTGRYGETFAPIEDTLTWGKGLPLDEEAAALEQTQAFDPLKDEAESPNADDSRFAPPRDPVPPAPPEPPMPPAPPAGQVPTASQHPEHAEAQSDGESSDAAAAGTSKTDAEPTDESDARKGK
ncbi:cell division ATP-binding protein FtsE [Bifidobacterium reuteri]|uniref:Cell division ATP-binding protein FtsE n=1 Tax=Bifidobacterium reuteri TaxID=983706 RepID=A0A5J5E7E5_9BIFI|nr:cell division ATP-binding protein FtsE [Bifidobacterium reuteri]KAA8825234.1 cell division ATP-binding protein FtsE [Bifidobacterium reuteri]